MKRTLKLTMVFKEGTEKENTFGTDEIAYEIWYFYETGIMEIDKIESFGDRRVVGMFKDKIHSREMIDVLLKIADVDFETFKREVLDKCRTEKNIV